MREIAVLLAEKPPKEEKARIKAEALIRDDNLLEAYEILQLECELLHERIKLLASMKNCPDDLVPVVSTLMYASQRVDIPELTLIRKQFRAKYGKVFEERAMNNADCILNQRVVDKLGVEPPPAYMVQSYLEKIAEHHKVQWEPKQMLTDDRLEQPMEIPTGYSVGVGQGTGFGEIKLQKKEDLSKPAGEVPAPVVMAEAYVPPAPKQGEQKSSDFEEVDIFIPPVAPSAPAGENGLNENPGDNEDDGDTKKASKISYDDLAARFENLKKGK